MTIDAMRLNLQRCYPNVCMEEDYTIGFAIWTGERKGRRRIGLGRSADQAWALAFWQTYHDRLSFRENLDRVAQ